MIADRMRMEEEVCARERIKVKSVGAPAGRPDGNEGFSATAELVRALRVQRYESALALPLPHSIKMLKARQPHLIPGSFRISYHSVHCNIL